ncbi:MAG: hypothetical protein SF066_01940 [Thermoanaerobaculia bacterium]|nr:hypothetical protein [Thermoanaerobaculia bacterium]
MKHRRTAHLTVAALAVALLGATTGCAVHVSTVPFQPSSFVRMKGSVHVAAVRYLPAEKNLLQPNQFEFDKAATVFFDIPLADHLRRCVVRELEASGLVIADSGAQLTVEITRYRLADKFTSLELSIESTWRLTVGDREVSRPLRAARRHAAYGSRKKAEDMNAMASELYEAFFADPEVKALMAASTP